MTTLACGCTGAANGIVHACFARPILGAVVAGVTSIVAVCGVNYQLSGASPKEECPGYWIESKQVCVTRVSDLE